LGWFWGGGFLFVFSLCFMLLFCWVSLNDKLLPSLPKVSMLTLVLLTEEDKEIHEI